MAQADGTILIDTEINADGMKAGSKEVEAAVRRMASSVTDLGTKARTALNKQVDSFAKLNQEYAAQAKKVDELKRKVAEYGNQKVPTEEYREIQAQIDQATTKMNRLIAQQERFEAMGGSQKSNTYKKYQYDIDELANTIKYAEGELRDLEETGKAFTFGSDTKEAAADMERLASAERKLADMNNRLGTSYSSIKGQVNDYNNALTKTNTQQQKASASGNKLSKSLSNTGKSAKSASFGIGRMLGTSILFSFVFQAISGVMNAMKDGFTNLAQYSSTTNNSISMLWSSLERLKNSLATAFAPILDVVAPILSKFIDMISTAASYVSMFFSFLSGKSTYTRAVAVQKDYAASLEDTAAGAKDAADATEDAAAAAEDYLSPLDDINKYNDTSSKSGAGSAGGGSGEGTTGPLFEEVEITDIPILEKVKDVLSGLFKPFKEAWAAEGQNTIDAAKYALQSLGDLAKSVGKSFYDVWTNGTGTEVLTYILSIAQNILETIGNIASKIEEAWNKNSIGTQIIQAIADGFLVILDFIDKISKVTATWAKNLDFYPLLESIRNLFVSLSPLLKTIGDYLYELYTTIILPVATFLIEKALPVLIDWISKLFNFLSENKWIIEVVGAALIGMFAAGKIVPLVTKIVGSVSSIIGVISGSGGLLAAIKTVVSMFGGPLTLAITGVVAAGVLLVTHWDDIKKAASKLASWISDSWDKIKEKTTKVWNSIKSFVGNIWDSLKKWASEKFNSIKNTISNSWDAIKSISSNVWSGIKSTLSSTWNGLKSNASSAFNSIKSNVSSIWNNVKSLSTSTWNSVKNSLSSIWNSMKSNASNSFGYIQNFVVNVWRNIGSAASSVWNGIVSSIRGAVNGIIGAINGMIRGVTNGINGVIRVLNRLSFTIPSWVPIFGGRRFGFNIRTISAPQIPYLASGAVIPPNKEFLAVLGDQKQGNNIEAPESLIRRIVREETGSGKGNTYEIPLKVGRRELAKLVIDEAKLMRQQTGQNPFELA